MFTATVIMLITCLAAGCADPITPAPPRTASPPNTLVPRPPISDESLIHLGTSHEGRSIDLVVFGREFGATLVLGGIHGNEQNSAQTAAALIAFLRINPAARGGHSVAVLACANPDGTTRGVRTNAHGVDLNRNFPAKNWAASNWKGPYFGGVASLSEPESRAVAAAVARLSPSRIISIHAMSSQPCNNWDGPAQSLAELMASHNGYTVKASIGYPTPGSLGSWAGIDRQIPTITLELPFGSPGAACWSHNCDALLAAITSSPSTASTSLAQ